MEIETKQSPEDFALVDAPYWMHLNKIRVDGRPFDLVGRKYQQEIMRPRTADGKFKHNEVIRKGSQIGITIIKVAETVHGALHGLYPQGIIIYFPSKTAVEMFSKSRFKPFVDDNPETIKKFMGASTDSVSVKRMGQTNIYFFGATATIRVGGEKKDSMAVRSTPADWILLDERDMFDEDITKQVNQRLGNSKIWRRTDMGTPTIPDLGVDFLYKKCVVPETKILTVDLQWKRADKLSIGDKLIGFDEKGLSRNRTRCYRTTEVTNCEKDELPCLKITLDDGSTTIVSWQHKFLEARYGNVIWKSAKALKIGDKLLSIGMWDEGVTKEDGWIAGVYDGEGHIHKSKPDRKKHRGQSCMIGFTQKDGLIMKQVEKILADKGFLTKKYPISNGCFRLDIRGGMPDRLRFMGTFRPIRLMEKAPLLWESISVGHDMGYTKTPKVLKIEYLGFKEVIVLSTKHQTFISDGLLSHNSNMGRWQIECSECRKHTCIETEFPGCIKLSDSGNYFKCSHCSARIDTNNGDWVPDSPKKDTVGYWVSQLLNPNCNLSLILKQYTDPEAYDMTEGEFQRIVMGLPYVSAEDELSESDVFACCGSDMMSHSSEIGCAMGIDVGLPNYAVIGYRKDRERYKIIKVARVPTFGDLHDLAARFNVKSCVIDAQSDIHMVRQFQSQEPYAVYLNYYSETLKTFDTWSSPPENIVKVNRTEIFDATHTMIRDPGVLVLPRVNEEMKVFARQMTRSVRVLETDQRTGAKIYRYRTRGDKEDHYGHALNYFHLACRKIGISQNKHLTGAGARPMMQDMTYKLGVTR